MKKVLLAMSGGVDSSVAALLLKKQGYEVIGAFMKNWSDTKNLETGECQWKEERRFAQKIALKLGIKLLTLDFEKEYKKLVVNEMFKKYKLGVTPNPDIDCNKEIKFPLLLKAAKNLKCDFIATGHYIRKKYNTKTKMYELIRAKDEMKDQSYFLYTIKQNELEKCLFPIGEHTKKEVREIAEKNNFPNYNKKSTVGICFIGKVNLKEFLQKKIKPKKGKILDPEGKIIGFHDGIFYYTIGQRIGPRFGINISHENEKGKDYAKWYVAKKEAKTNIIVAAPEGHPLNFRKEVTIKDFYLIDEKKGNYKKKKKILVRIRQVGELLPAVIFFEKGKFRVNLKKEINGVSNGQAIVFYEGKKVLGGGVINF